MSEVQQEGGELKQVEDKVEDVEQAWPVAKNHMARICKREVVQRKAPKRIQPKW